MVNNRIYISAAQIRGARATLNWSQDALAEKTDLSITTIRKIESGHISPRDSTNEKIRTAFECAGLEFITPDGVRRKPEEITVYEGEEGGKVFLDDIYNTGIGNGQDIVQVWPAEARRKFFEMMGDYRRVHLDRMLAAKTLVGVKTILTENTTDPIAPYTEARFLSRSFVDSVPFYVYGDKFAVIDFHSSREGKIIVVQSKSIADAFRRQFVSMWEKATPLVNPNSTLPKSP